MRRLGAVLLTSALLLGATACTDDDDPPEPRTPTSVGTDLEERPDRGSPDGPLVEAPPLTKRFHPARSPRELGARIIVAEGLARAERTEEDVRQAAAFETQLLYRQLARTPAWETAVRRRVPGSLRSDIEAHLTARRSLRSVVTTLSDEVPAWEIVEPAPTADLLRFYREGQRTYGVPWEVLAAINLVETGFGKIRGLSTAGAQGPMQFIPSTWAAYGEGDINDPHDAILAAARYLAANGGDSAAGLETALYRYNNHTGYVAGIRAYASVLERDPRALGALVRWQIVYLSTIGDLWLPVGYLETAPVPVRAYVRRHPERHLGTATD